MIRPFNGLRPADAEVLAWMAEESGEIVRAVGKILRHGLHSRHPDGGPDNREQLSEEIGNLMAAVDLAHAYGLVDLGLISESKSNKLKTVDKWLHHASTGTIHGG